jgi:hypothetical protein
MVPTSCLILMTTMRDIMLRAGAYVYRPGDSMMFMFQRDAR